MPANQKANVELLRPVVNQNFRTRVYYDCNITPITKRYYGHAGSPYVEPDENGEYRFYQLLHGDRYCQLLGMEPLFFVYEGTIQQSSQWSLNGEPQDLTESGNRWNLPYASQNHTDYAVSVGTKAGFDLQIKTLANLSNNPNFYNGATIADLKAPIVYNIETRGSTFNKDTTSTNIETILERTTLWNDLFLTTREELGKGVPFYAYGYGEWFAGRYAEALPVEAAKPEFDEFVAMEALNSRLLDGDVAFFYNWDATVTDGQQWVNDVKFRTWLQKTYYPHWEFNRIAVINPVYSLYFSNPIYNWTLVPFGVWQREIDYLVDNGWDICVWLGDFHSYFTDIDQFYILRKYLEYARRCDEVPRTVWR